MNLTWRRNKIIFWRIEDPASKKLVKTRRISDQSLYVNHLAIISENYPHREDSLVIFENIKDQIGKVYRNELAYLGSIKTKIVLIAHMYWFIIIGRFYNHQID